MLFIVSFRCLAVEFWPPTSRAFSPIPPVRSRGALSRMSVEEKRECLRASGIKPPRKRELSESKDQDGDLEDLMLPRMDEAVRAWPFVEGGGGGVNFTVPVCTHSSDVVFFCSTARCLGYAGLLFFWHVHRCPGSTRRAHGEGLAAGGLCDCWRPVRREKRETHRRGTAANREIIHSYMILRIKKRLLLFSLGLDS